VSDTATIADVGSRTPGIRPPATRWIAIGALIVALVLAGCGAGERSASGLVVAVEPIGPAEIGGFTLRTEDGETIVFRVGALDTSSGGFDALHLNDHFMTGQPVAVAYRLEDGSNVAVRIVDAPWVEP
jgi:hypothetical protein